jgi:hypothetical protein
MPLGWCAGYRRSSVRPQGKLPHHFGALTALNACDTSAGGSHLILKSMRFA